MRAARLLRPYLHLCLCADCADHIAGGDWVSIASIGLLTAINGLLGLLSMTLNAAHSDHARERRWRIAIPLLLTAAAFLVSGTTKNSWWLVAAFAVAITGLYATQGIIYSIPGSFLKGKSAATGIAIATTMGILGGFAGPAWIGWMRDVTGSFQIGLMSLAIPCVTGHHHGIVKGVPDL